MQMDVLTQPLVVPSNSDLVEIPFGFRTVDLFHTDECFKVFKNRMICNSLSTLLKPGRGTFGITAAF